MKTPASTASLTCRLALGTLGVVCLAFSQVGQADEFTYRNREGKKVSIEGNVILRDRAGNMKVETRDMQHVIVWADRLVSHEKKGEKVKPFSEKQLQKHLTKEYGPGYSYYKTNNYLICYNCDKIYAKEASKLFERAAYVFKNYFRTRGGMKLKTPDYPMVAIVCKSREEYIKITAPMLGQAALSTAGIYDPESNRMYMFDALGGKTGELIKQYTKITGKSDQVFLLKSQNVATLIHEAIHQVAFNSGMHNRMVKNPVWLIEGMATYFETPDFSSRRGWSGAGKINKERLDLFKETFTTRKKEQLDRLILKDEIFRDNDTALASYAEAWAFTYFLAKARTKQYSNYLKILAERPPSFKYSEEDRLADFKKAFRVSPSEMEKDFKRYMIRVVRQGR